MSSTEVERLLSVEDVLREVLPVGRTLLYDLVRSGEIPVVKIGRRTFFRSGDLRDFVDRSIETPGT